MDKRRTATFQFWLAWALVLAGVFTSMSPAMACECSGPRTARDALQGAAAVFVATVIAIQPEPDTTMQTVTFRVKDAWKGVYNPDVTARTESWGLCGYPFDVGDNYLIYATAGESGLEVDNCHRTYPLEPGPDYERQAQQDLEALGPPASSWSRADG